MGQLRASTSDRAAFSRPTVGPRLAERPQAVGGRANYASLERSRARLLSRLHVIECDISKLPSRVGMLVVPSNEMLADPGFGAMHAIYEQGGAALRSWVHTYRQARASALRAESAEAAGGDGTPLAPGDAVASPAFGSIQAEWLCHAVGISFYDPNQFQRVVLSTEPSSADQTAHAAEELRRVADAQLGLIRNIFREAARAGVTSLAMPAVSSGKRKFPPLLNASIALSVAATEILASGGELDVYFVSWGDENHHDSFACAREAVSRALVPLSTAGAASPS